MNTSGSGQGFDVSRERETLWPKTGGIKPVVPVFGGGFPSNGRGGGAGRGGGGMGRGGRWDVCVRGVQRMVRLAGGGVVGPACT